MENCIVMGPALDADGIKEFKEAIMAILLTTNDQDTKKAALSCLRQGVQLSGGDHGMLNGCNISLGPDGVTKKKRRPAAKKKRRS